MYQLLDVAKGFLEKQNGMPQSIITMEAIPLITLASFFRIKYIKSCAINA